MELGITCVYNKELISKFSSIMGPWPAAINGTLCHKQKREALSFQHLSAFGISCPVWVFTPWSHGKWMMGNCRASAPCMYPQARPGPSTHVVANYHVRVLVLEGTYDNDIIFTQLWAILYQEVSGPLPIIVWLMARLLRIIIGHNSRVLLTIAIMGMSLFP